MQTIEVQFKCGKTVTVWTALSRMAEAGVGASVRSEEIARRVVKNNLEYAEAIFEEHVILVSPLFRKNDDGSCDVPPYRCAVGLWTISEEREYRRCYIQWYQEQLMPDISGVFSEWASTVTWKEAVDGSFKRDF